MDKIFALTLYKQSAKGYRLLQKTFALPSKKTLTNMLNKIPFNTGLNQCMRNVLGQNVKKMKDLHKYCILIFDDIALKPALQYNKKQDEIEGFVDIGGNKQAKFADHVTVFMLRGIYKKWKQPLSYFYIESSMDAVALKSKIVENIEFAQAIGLHVVATVCDQSSINSRSIKLLCHESSAKLLRQEEENRSLGFLVNGEE